MVNDLVRNNDYICKSKISELKKVRALKNVPLSAIREQFDKCINTKNVISGNPFYKRRQRHTKYVSRKELELRVFRDYFRSSR